MDFTKASLSFVTKAWWTLVRHRLRSAIGDNTPCHDRDALVPGIIEGYDIDVPRYFLWRFTPRIEVR